MFVGSNALVGRTFTAGRAAVNAEPAVQNSCPRYNCCFLAAGNAAITTTGVANATCLAIAGRAAVAAADGATLAAGRAALAAGRAAPAAGSAAVNTAAEVATAACLADALAAVVAAAGRRAALAVAGRDAVPSAKAAIAAVWMLVLLLLLLSLLSFSPPRSPSCVFAILPPSEW